MIYATDTNEEFTTCWYCPPPPPGAGFIVVQQEWDEQDGQPVRRNIRSWRYPDPPAPDAQGWRPVPAWQREIT